MASSDLVVNGKRYPIWSHFVINKQEWIGGTLVDLGMFGIYTLKTEIIDITLEDKNGDTWFTIVGKDFSCGTDVMYLSIPSDQDDKEWIEFSIPIAGDRFKIKRHP